MAEKIKKASPYILILVLVGLVIAFNFWSALDKDLWNKYVKADAGDSGTVGSSVSVGNTAPTIHTCNVYGAGIGTGVVLIENAAIDLMATITITDDNGCSDIQGNGNVEAWFLTSDNWWDHINGGVSCTYDENNCYNNSVVSCSFASCAGNTATYQCVSSASVAVNDRGGWKYFADATQENDDQASKTHEEWIVIVYVSDSYGNDVTSDSWLASDSVNVNLYSAIDIEESASGSIPYTTLNPGGKTGSPGILVGIRNTGNRGLDPIIEEYGSMSLDGQDDTYINTARQQYSASSFAVPAGTSLSGDNPATAPNYVLNLNLPQRGDGDDNNDEYTSISDDQLYWGIDIPSDQTAGDYKGSVSYTTTPD